MAEYLHNGHSSSQVAQNMTEQQVDDLSAFQSIMFMYNVYEILSNSETLRHTLVYKCYINPPVNYKYNISCPTFVTTFFSILFKKTTLKEKNTHKISTLTLTLVIPPFVHL